MGLKVIDNILGFVRNNGNAMDRALNRMAVDIERQAKSRVPVSATLAMGNKRGGGGHLRASGTHRKQGFLKYIVEFNKEYAAFQEWGGDGKRIVRHYTTPGTGKFYLRDAGRNIAGKAFDYFKQEARSIGA